MKINYKLFLFLVSLVFLSSLAGADWKMVGSDYATSYVQDEGNTYISENYQYSYLHSDKTSLVEPLIVDLNNDSISEIIIFRTDELRLYGGSDYHYIDTYVNTSLDIVGNAVVVDWDLDGVKEIIFTANNSLWSISYNNNFTLEKVISGTGNAGSLKCLDLYAGDEPECCFTYNSQLYCYNHTDTSTTAPKVTFSYQCSPDEISFMDYDKDGDNDIFFIAGEFCENLEVVRNNNDGTFTKFNTYNVTNSINQFALADLDGGHIELVITDSHYCTSNTSCGSESKVNIFNAETGAFICSKEFKDLNELYDSPYLTGLHTCYYQEGAYECDYDNDGFNDIYVVTILPETLQSGSNNATLYVIDDDCEVLYEKETTLTSRITGGDYQTDTSTTNYGKAVWQNFDEDDEYELYLWNGIMNKDGSTLIQFNSNETDEFANGYNFITTGDVSGDGLFEIIHQKDNSQINVLSFAGYCTDSDFGFDIYTYGFVTITVDDVTIYHYDECSSYDNTRILEQWCSEGVYVETNAPCGEEEVCIEGVCLDVGILGVCTDSDGYWIYEKGYVILNESGVITTYYDECVSDTQIKEQWCYGDEYRYTIDSCQAGEICEDGRCVSTIQACIDSDNGVNIHIAGNVTLIIAGEEYLFYDECFSAYRVKEEYCDGTIHVSINVPCPADEMCYENKCVLTTDIITCLDSDGNDIYNKGFVTLNITGEIVTKNDRCAVQENRVLEQTCESSSVYAEVSILCDEGQICYDGRCIEEALIVEDFPVKIDRLAGMMGFYSTTAKILLVIMIMIVVGIVVNKEYKNMPLTMILEFLIMVGATYLGWFPIWLLFLVFFVGALATYLFVNKLLSGD